MVENLRFFDDEKTVIKKIRDDLKQNREEISKIHPTNKSTIVALVEKSWFASLVFWLSDQEMEIPGPISNHLLCNNGKFDVLKKVGVDFVVFTEKGWEILFKHFSGGPKIIRYYVLHPKNNTPTVIAEPTQIIIEYNHKEFKKVVDSTWEVRPIFKLFCKSLEIDYRDHLIASVEGEQIPHEYKVDESISKFSNKWIVIPDPSSRKVKEKLIRIDPKTPSTLHPITNSFPFTFLHSAIHLLFSIVCFRDFIIGYDVGEIVSHNIKLESLVIFPLQKLFLEMLEKGNQPIKSENLRKILFDRKPTLQADDIHDVCESLLSIISAIEEDLSFDGPSHEISQMFCGVFCGILECSHCQNFENVCEDFSVIQLPIPQVPEPGLFDSIALLSQPKQIPSNKLKICRRCQKQSLNTKTITVHSVGKVLILNFQRINKNSFARTKDKTIISFPKEFDTASFSSNSSGICKLRSVSYHNGEYDNGTFATAILDEKTNQWNYFEEEKGTIIGEDLLENSAVSCLIYEIL